MLKSRKFRFVAIVLAAGILAVGAVVVVTARNGKDDLAEVKQAVNPYRDTAAAEAAGWVLLPDLDHCFESEAGAMGIHYINPELLMNTELDPLKPEALVYQHLPNGKLQLGAVEYIVPMDLWEAEGHEGMPMLHGQHFHANDALGVWVLHAWIFKNNPEGMFEDWNPKVSCPAS
jgi:hypothetical protein